MKKGTKQKERGWWEREVARDEEKEAITVIDR